MSEQKQSYMQQLDAWAFQSVIEPLLKAAESGSPGEWDKTHFGIYAAIRQKVLESYRETARTPRAQSASRAAIGLDSSSQNNH